MDKETVSSNFSNLDDKIELARDLVREQNFVQARKFLEELIKLSPKHPDINYLLGQLYELDENYKKAVECFAVLLEYDASYDLKCRIAMCFLDGEEYDKAYILLKELYQENCEDLNVVEQFAHVARIIGQVDEAVIAYNFMLDSDKNNLVALTQLSEIYYDIEDKMNHYLIKAKLNYIENMLSSAADCLKKALHYSSDDEDIINILLNLGKVLTEAGKYHDALEQYQFILNLEPDNSTAANQIEALTKKIGTYGDEDEESEEETSPDWVAKLVAFFGFF